MKDMESKPLSAVIFIPLLALVFLRPFLSGLAYPVLESYYENCAIMLAILALASEQRFLSNLKTNPFGLAISLLLAGYVISTIFSINIHNSFREIIRFISYISIFFIISEADNLQKKILIKTIVITAMIISAYAIYQYFWGYGHTLQYLEKTNSSLLLQSSYAKDILIAKRAIGTFPSPNILGGYLATIFFLTLYILFKHNPGPKTRHASHLYLVRMIPPLFIILWALVLTKSMGAWLSLIAGLIVLFLLYSKAIKYKKLVLIAFLTAILLILSFILSTRWERFVNLEDPRNSITQRLNYWRTAMAVIKDHPFSGIGPGNFQEVFLKYKVGLSTDTRYAHNILLHAWAETGFLGFAAMVFLIITFIKKAAAKDKYLLLAGIAFLLHNLIDNSYFIPETGIFWWILSGLTLK